MDKLKNNPQRRDASLDIARAIAIVGVLLIHASAQGFSGFGVGSINWFVSVGWGAILRPAVPLFFMVSGALLLNPEKDVETKTIYTKYLPRIIIALFVWATLYEIYDIAVSGKTIGEAVKNIVLFKHHFHFYYLHIIVLVYAFLPITRVFIKNATKKHIEYSIVIWMLLAVIYPFMRQRIQFLNAISGIPAQYVINMTYGAIGYGILGYYLKKYPLRRRYSLLYAVGLIITVMGTVYVSMQQGHASGAYYEGMTPNVLLMAVGIYVFCMNCKKGTFAKKLSKASFCIYLVHDFFNMIFLGLGLSANSFSPLISIPVIVVSNLLLCIAVHFVLSRISIVKKYLI